MNGEQSKAALGTSDLWYNASCYECVQRHRIAAKAEENNAQQEVEEHVTRSISTASQQNYFCDLLRCRTVKYDKRGGQEHSRPTERGRSGEDRIAQELLSEADAEMDNLRVHARVSEQHLSADLRRAPKLKSSIHGLRDRLKKSISNMSLRTTVTQDVQEDAGPHRTNRLKSPASKLSLRTAFGKQPSPQDTDRGDANALRSTFSNMSLRRAFQRREPEFTMVTREEVEEEHTLVPPIPKRLAIHEDSPARGRGLRQACSDMSLRSSNTIHSMLEGESEVPTESVSSLVRKRGGNAGDISARSLRQTVSAAALRAGFVSPGPERDDLGPTRTSARRKRLAIAGQLPPRGGVLIPPTPEYPNSSPDGYQFIANPELMVHTQATKDLIDAGDMYVATGLRPSRPSSTIRRHHGSADTLGETFSTHRKDKFCDTETLAILTGASYTTSAPNHLDYRPDWSDPFLQGYLADRHAARHVGQGDDGYRPPARSRLKPSLASSTQNRDDVSVLRDSELFANFDSGARSVSPLTAPQEGSSERQSGGTVQQQLRQDQPQRKNSASTLHATPRSTLRPDDASMRGAQYRHSLQSSSLSWVGSNIDDFCTFLEAAEHDEL